MPGTRQVFTRAARAIAVPLLCSLALIGPARAAEPGGGREPRLVLPGGHVVRAGQWIELRWGAAEDVTELELLLSVDGGRHYSLCSAPRLDPRRHALRWRVPDARNGSLRLRIRFNRDGREIEGAPTAALAVDAPESERPEPLALPPLASGDPAGNAGARGERGSPAAGVAVADPAKDERRLPDHPLVLANSGAALLVRAARPAGRHRDRFLPPRALPLRT